MAKTKRWRQIRQHRRREKARLYKLDKPIRNSNHESGQSTEEMSWFFDRFLPRLMLKKEKKLDRRNQHTTGQEQGDR